jgi:5-formyltetrahydrofolate cyclo-ligase
LGVGAEKEVLRHRILELRDNMESSDVEAKSLKIADAVTSLPEYAKAKIVACYVNMGSEVQTRPLIKNALGAGKKVLVPVTKKNGRELIFSEIPSLHELAPGAFGIMEPNPNKRKLKDVTTSDLLIVPGVVWDIYGYRLGWGRGYFDGVLKKLGKNTLPVGLSFDLQLVESVPREQFDLPVKILVTESRVIHYNA